jgi:ATP-dependent exoDNAse (exonuclease V) alpha subunit
MNEAQKKAVQDTMKWAIDRGYFRANMRDNNGKVISAPAEEMVCIGFWHQLSREKDPNVHHHILIANHCRTADGTAHSVDFGKLLSQRKTMDRVYKMILRAQLEKAGIACRNTKDGFELAALSNTDVEAFSLARGRVRRGREIYAERLGKSVSELTKKEREYGALLFRPAKGSDFNRQELMIHWLKRVDELCMDLSKIKSDAALVSKVEEAGKMLPALVDLATRLTANEQGTFDVQDVVDKAAKLARDPDGVFLSPDAPPVKNITVTEDAVRRIFYTNREKNGVIKMPDGSKMTTQTLLVAEAENRAYIAQGQGLFTEGNREQIGQAVAHYARKAFNFKFEGEGRDAAIACIASPNSHVAVSGLAGTGKTTLFKAVVGVVGSDKILGCSKGGAQAQKLGEEAGIQGKTLDRVCIDFEQRQQALARTGNLSLRDKKILRQTEYLDQTLGQNESMIIVDEAGMAGSIDLNRINKVAAYYKAKIIWAGDDRQKHGVATGSPFAEGIGMGMETVNLTEIRRQREGSLDKIAVQTVARGDTSHALDILERSGKIHVVPDLNERLQLMAVQQAKWILAGENRPVAMTHTNAERERLNELVRDQLREAGYLKLETRSIEILDREKFTKERSFAQGERITFGKNDTQRLIEVIDRPAANKPAIEIKNGHTGRISAFHDDGKVDVRLDDGHLVRWDPSTYRQVDFGYMQTTHRAQGASEKAAVVNLNSESYGNSTNDLYVAISRHKEDLVLYTDNLDKLKTAVSKWEKTHSVLDTWEMSQQRGDHPYADALQQATQERQEALTAAKAYRTQVLAGKKVQQLPKMERTRYNQMLNDMRVGFAKKVRTAHAEFSTSDTLSRELDQVVDRWTQNRQAAADSLEASTAPQAMANFARTTNKLDNQLGEQIKPLMVSVQQDEQFEQVQAQLKDARERDLYAGGCTVDEKKEHAVTADQKGERKPEQDILPRTSDATVGPRF